MQVHYLHVVETKPGNKNSKNEKLEREREGGWWCTGWKIYWITVFLEQRDDTVVQWSVHELMAGLLLPECSSIRTPDKPE